MIKKYKNYLKHILIYFISFVLNYLIFILLMIFINKNNPVGIQVINLISWVVSMLFIFYIDKKYVPDLVNENNSNELFKFILIRILSLMIEVVILFIFVSVLGSNYYTTKLISLVVLFLFNSFYVRRIKFN